MSEDTFTGLEPRVEVGAPDAPPTMLEVRFAIETVLRGRPLIEAAARLVGRPTAHAFISGLQKLELYVEKASRDAQIATSAVEERDRALAALGKATAEDAQLKTRIRLRLTEQWPESQREAVRIVLQGLFDSIEGQLAGVVAGERSTGLLDAQALILEAMAAVGTE